jgi:hypothetical protein
MLLEVLDVGVDVRFGRIRPTRPAPGGQDSRSACKVRHACVAI